MTREELFTDPTFLRLPETQQKFVRNLVDCGNEKIAAAHKTWNCSSDASAAVMANRALHKAGIRKLVNAFYGIQTKDLLPTRDEVAALAWERCQKAKDDGDAHKWLLVVNQVLGYNTRPADNPKDPEAPKASEDAEDDLMAELEQRVDTRGSETEL